MYAIGARVRINPLSRYATMWRDHSQLPQGVVGVVRRFNESLEHQYNVQWEDDERGLRSNSYRLTDLLPAEALPIEELI